jgi:hypothetical protein
MDFIEARGGEYISYKMELQLGLMRLSEPDLQFRPAQRFFPNFWFEK